MVNISHRHYLAEAHYGASGKEEDVKMFSYNYNPSDNVKPFVSGGSGCSAVHGRLLKPRAIYDPQQKNIITKYHVQERYTWIGFNLAILHAVAHNIDSQ